MTFSQHDSGRDPLPQSRPQPLLRSASLRQFPERPVSATAPWRLSIGEHALEGANLPDRTAAATNYGWQHIGLVRTSVWSHGEEQLRELLSDQNLSVSSLGWTGGFTGSAGFSYREAIDDGRQAIHEASLLGAETLLVAPGSRAGHTFRHAQRVIVDGVRHLSDFAARHRVRLAVLTQPMGRSSQKLSGLESLELAEQFLDQVESPWVGLVVPIESWLRQQSNEAAWQTLAPRIQMVISSLRMTTSSPTWENCDESTGDVAALFQLLKLSGFRGQWELEAGRQAGMAASPNSSCRPLNRRASYYASFASQ